MNPDGIIRPVHGDGPGSNTCDVPEYPPQYRHNSVVWSLSSGITIVFYHAWVQIFIPSARGENVIVKYMDELNAP